ncbi:hypothetical protein BC940DRAFT_263180 [Gongronella butleri]|nr:hypothetical protein BC940DRAFT_263180 [Gongronella butleri]
MRLTVSNANIKDDTATLVSVGIHPYCIVELQGEQVNEEQVAASTQSGNPEEYALIRRMDVILSGMDDLLVVIDEYEAMVQAAAPPLDEDAKKKIHDKGVYCSEGLMQALIRLDSVECPMGFETARQQRRQGVRHVQKHLDRVDGMRTKAKALTQ